MARPQGGTNTAPPKLDTHSPEPLAVGAEDKAAGWDSSRLDTALPKLDTHSPETLEEGAKHKTSRWHKNSSPHVGHSLT